MFYLNLFIAFILSLPLAVSAASITQDKPILLNQESPSQTIQISLDAIPEKLIKRDGQIKNQKIRARFSLKKKDRKNIELNPKNGRVVIEVRDGEIIPAELTITAKDPSVEVIADYTIKAPKKLRKRLKIESYSDTVNLSENLHLKLRVAIPDEDLDKFPFVARLENNQKSRRNSTSAEDGDVVLSFWDGSAYTDLPSADPGEITITAGESIVTPSGERQTVFNVDLIAVMPSPQEGSEGVFGAAFLVNIPGTNSLNLFSNVLSNNLLVSPRSTFVFERILSSGVDPLDISLEEIRELIEIVDNINFEDRDLSTTSKILEAIEEELGTTLDLLIASMGSSDTELGDDFAFASQSYKRYTIKARPFSPSNLLFNQYEVSQFNYVREARVESVVVTSNKFYADLYYFAKFRDTPIISPFEPRAKFLAGADNAFETRPPRQSAKPHSYNRVNNTFMGSGWHSSANYEDKVLAVNNDLIFEHFSDTFNSVASGVDSEQSDPFYPIDTDLVVNEVNSVDVYAMLGVQIGQFKGTESVNLAEKFRDTEPWLLGFGTFQDKDGFMKFENIFTKCSTGDDKTCDADFISVTSAYNSATGNFDISNIFSPAVDGSLRVSGSHQNPDLDFRWSTSENWKNKVSKFDSAIDFNRLANFAVKLQSQANGSSRAASMAFLLKSSDQFANYVGDYYVYGYGYGTSASGHSAFIRAGNLQFSLDSNNEPAISMQLNNRHQIRFTSNLLDENSSHLDFNDFTDIDYNNESTVLENLVIDMEVDTPLGLEVVRCIAVEGDEILACRFYDVVLEEVEDNVESSQSGDVHMGLFFAVKHREI